MGANPPSSVLTGFSKRVWQAQGNDRISFMPNGIILVRFKTKEQQQFVLNNGHLLFDNKPVIFNEWEPDTELVKHDVKRIPIWMKLYDLDVKFWGLTSLKKLSSAVGKFIRCDENTLHKNFLGFSRIMIEVKIGQQFPDQITFKDENGKNQRARVKYDWLPLSCSKCKGLGYLAANCRKDGSKPVTKKVWKPRKVVNKPDQKVQPPPKVAVVKPRQPVVPTTPVNVVTIKTPVIVPNTPVVESTMPRRLLIRLIRHGTGEKRTFTPGGLSFMESLTQSIQKTTLGIMENKAVDKKETSKDTAQYGLHHGGRIWLLWDPNLYDVTVLDIQVQCIHSEVLDKARRNRFWFTVVYGLNKLVEREPLWDSLRTYYGRITGPWVVGGDFNAIMASNERIGGAPITNAEMRPLLQVTQDCQLYDLGDKGAFYTRTNKHEVGSKVCSRLDRVLINDEWLAEFPDSYTHFLPEGVFDHCPAIIRLEMERQRNGYSFKYFNMWDCGLLHLTIRRFKDPLNVELNQTEKIYAKELEELQKARDQFLRQKAKVDWMQMGDHNTAFFDASIKSRRSKNRVFQVKDMNGQMCSSPEKIQSAFEEYYMSLLGTSHEVRPINRKIVQHGKCLTAAHCSLLTAPVTGAEIKEAMFSIPGNKTPGPDGYSSQFFKENWEIVGGDIINVVQNVFRSGKVLKQCNNTILTLIPKVVVPESVLQFRPIACCNTVYKFVSKVLCARIGKVLPDIISQSQGAFIKGRDIVGNILICQDLIKLYKRKSCSPRAMMKIDLQKAYDSVEWAFVGDMIDALGFPLLICNIVKECISTTSYSISLNGEIFGFFKATGNGMEEHTIKEVEMITGMKRGTMPFTYLGVTVSPKRLSIQDCQCLVNKVVDRIRGMGSRKLSYAGRMARIFILPKNVISKIESVCRKYLWHGSDHKESPALVSWDQICQPKKQGGLGLRDFHVWNLATVGKYALWVANKANHLWLRWVHAVYFKTSSWSEYNPGSGCSWAWRKICQEESMNHLFFECPFSRQCRDLVSEWCRFLLHLQNCISWWIELRQEAACKKKVIAMILSGLLYHVWHCRNRCRVDEYVVRPTVVLANVKSDVKMRLGQYDIRCKNALVLEWVEYLKA
ncbi:uncharacterized protein LOC141613690 [Silene latifolia]|uniref:uncharacterized protein LOC141613690 n=1 Tax=Silene latifolia TaxID=37657 RepID=UPI003D781DD7